MADAHIIRALESKIRKTEQELIILKEMLADELRKDKNESHVAAESLVNRELPLHDGLTTELNEFPSNANRERQVIWLFEAKFRKATKLSDIDSEYKRLLNTNKSISNIARNMKDKNLLVAVKYNGINKYTWWGLPNWIDKDRIGSNKEDFLSQYRPSDELPINITESKVLES